MLAAWNGIDLFAALPWATAAFVIGYLLGSIPFGLIFTRMAGLGDLRSIGSGNIGATNALRTGNKKVALATLICDGGKGAVAIFVALQLAKHVSAGNPSHWQNVGDVIRSLNFSSLLAMKAAAGAFLGHLFPVWLRFKGGKGVATFIGIHLALCWPAGVLCCLTWLAMAVMLRYSSLSALVAALLTPAYLVLFHQMQYLPLSIFLVILIYITHRENIKRLLARTEPQIGAKK